MAVVYRQTITWARLSFTAAPYASVLNPVVSPTISNLFISEE